MARSSGSMARSAWHPAREAPRAPCGGSSRPLRGLLAPGVSLAGVVLEAGVAGAAGSPKPDAGFASPLARAPSDRAPPPSQAKSAYPLKGPLVDFAWQAAVSLSARSYATAAPKPGWWCWAGKWPRSVFRAVASADGCGRFCGGPKRGSKV